MGKAQPKSNTQPWTQPLSPRPLCWTDASVCVFLSLDKPEIWNWPFLRLLLLGLWGTRLSRCPTRTDLLCFGWNMSALGQAKQYAHPMSLVTNALHLFSGSRCIWISLRWPNASSFVHDQLWMSPENMYLFLVQTYLVTDLSPAPPFNIPLANLLDSPLDFCVLDGAKHNVPGCTKLQRVSSRGNYRVPYRLTQFWQEMFPKEVLLGKSPVNFTVSSKLCTWANKEVFASRNGFHHRFFEKARLIYQFTLANSV